MVNYTCEICGKVSTQKSHHDAHLKSKDHRKECEIFKLNLVAFTLEEIIEEYPQFKPDVDRLSDEDFLIDGESEQDNINAVKKAEKNLKYEIAKKIIKMKSTVKSGEISETNEPNKYIPSNKIIWELSENVENNENYKGIKSNLESLIKQCHNILYNSSIVGQKAQNDIMRLLCIKILQYQFHDENSELWDKCNQVKADNNISDTNFTKYKKFCKDLKQLYKTKNGLLSEWKGFVNKFLTFVFPSIYYEDDSKFNCIDENTLQNLINKIETLEINDEFIDSFSTTCGDIHESFRAYGGGKGAKELGQYFTPRQLIHLIFHGLDLKQYLKKIDDPSIYDPCMGTGGFLTRLFNLGNIKSENIYGCETELDTIKFGEMSLFLTTKGNKQNIIKCNSLSENPLMINKKVDVIVTNPPFGTKMNYKSFKETYDKKFPNSKIKFEEVYPLKVNNGACLFVQHCVYMLNDGGVCIIVLPDGELFEGNSKWSKNYRKWLCDNVNIHTILKCPGGTFDHAGVKTNVVIFTKGGPTQNIKYIETTKECEKITELITITKGDLEKTQYSLDINEYIEEKDIYDYPTIEFEKAFTIIHGKIQSSKTNKDENGTLLLTGAKYSNMFNIIETDTSHSYVEGNNLFMCCGGNGDSVPIRYYEGKCFYSCLMGLCKIISEYENKINPKFYYYYFTQIKSILEEKYQSGSCNKRLNIQKLNKLKIPLPSLEIQEKIVEELSIIETNIESIEIRIKQLKEEKERFKKYSRKSEIKELLKDAEIKKLRDLYDIKYGNKNPTHKCDGEKFPSISGGSKISKYTDEWNIPENTIIIARSGSCGSVNMFPEKCLCGSYGFFLDIKDNNINNIFIHKYLKDNQHEIEDLGRGQTVQNLNRDRLYDYKIKYPSPEIQEQCIQIYQEKEKFIQSIDDKIEVEKNYIEDLKQLSKDIIHNYC